ncbi:hypothetical protein pb186bvf_009776 [Paramecium bursaria]
MMRVWNLHCHKQDDIIIGLNFVQEYQFQIYKGAKQNIYQANPNQLIVITNQIYAQAKYIIRISLEMEQKENLLIKCYLYNQNLLRTRNKLFIINLISSFSDLQKQFNRLPIKIPGKQFYHLKQLHFKRYA